MSSSPTSPADPPAPTTNPAPPTAPSNPLPSGPFSQSLYNHVRHHLHPAILAHSIRVYIYAEALITKVDDIFSIPKFQPTTTTGSPDIFRPAEDESIDQPLLFAATLFHDMGTCAAHDHAQRFEVCGADAAVAYLQSNGMSNIADQRKVWEAIALHTSPGIAERMSLLTRVVRMAVKADFGGEEYRSLLGEGFVERTEALFPRGEVERVLGDCVAMQAERRQGEGRSKKAPAATWPWNLLRNRLENPGWEGVNKGF
jgi:hypothetical protein